MTLHDAATAVLRSTAKPIITLEEHFLSEVAAAAPSQENAAFKAMPDLWASFTDLEQRRVDDMEAGHVTLQVVSHGPGDLSVEQCRAANNQLAAAIAARPDRLAGFAELPMHDPPAAAAELRRTCLDLGFLGALVDSHTDAGLYYEGPDFDVLWSAAVDLDVPIYIHPTWATSASASAYASQHLSAQVTASIQAFGFGWHSDVAMHLLRLYAAGVFDRFPRLRLVMGHMGEMVPYMFQRIERLCARWQKERSFRNVWDENVWVTTSGNWSLDPLACMLRNTRHDRIMYSVDYPFSKSADGLKWLQDLEKSGMVDAETLEAIRWKNAARLFKLDGLDR